MQYNLIYECLYIYERKKIICLKTSVIQELQLLLQLQCISVVYLETTKIILMVLKLITNIIN